MKKGKKNAAKTIIIGCILVAFLVFFYYYVAHRMETDSKEEVTITKTQQVLLRNLETNYPPSPKEVVKYYCDITQCIYNETHTDDELKKLGAQIQLLYDDELIANQTQEEYMRNLISDVASMQKQELVVSSYSTSASTDVEFFTEDGFEWARLYCAFALRQKTTLINSNERFLLRKDGDDHWKIYGWELVEE